MLCSCKRKCGRAQAVLKGVKSLLRSLPTSVLTAPLCSSAVVHEWARANLVLEESERESLCQVLQDVGAGEVLKWLWLELKEYQSLDRFVCTYIHTVAHMYVRPNTYVLHVLLHCV